MSCKQSVCSACLAQTRSILSSHAQHKATHHTARSCSRLPRLGVWRWGLLSILFASTVFFHGHREPAAEVGFDILDRIMLSSSRHGGSGYRDGTSLTADYILSPIFTVQCRGRELAAEGLPPTTQLHVSNIKYIDCVVGSYIVLPSSEGSRVGSADCKVLFQAVTILFGALMPVFGIDCIDGAVYTEYMSREPAAKVGFDSCDHTVLSTARHHDHAVFLFLNF